MELREQIGKIILDYQDYPGEDFYCDGEVEDELLAIARDHSPVEFGQIIEEKKSWPVLYHLSSQRENIVSWLPINKDMKVLEIGSGCGAITGALSKKAGSVTCVDLSKKRSLINAYRHEDCDNVTIRVGNFQDIEPKLDIDYDYALLIGVFEYGQSYIGGETPFEDFLKIIRKHVKNDGKIVIAIENKYGLKYWAGCREDHLGTFFSNIENYPDGGGVRTFSKKGLERIFDSCGETEYSFYYPYPDYKFMTTLYSDKYLPKIGELYNNLRNYDRDRMLLFDEKKVFDGLIEEEMFPFYSNSYLVVLGNKPDTEYIRYSNDRAPQYQISTEICKAGRKRIVKKHALLKEGIQHIENMQLYFEKLNERYNTKKLTVNPILDSKENDTICFPFEKGVLLSERMDNCLKCNDEEGFLELFREFVKRIDHNNNMEIADMDLVFSNILVDKDKWTIIDYEWTKQQKVETKELAFRALYCYLLEDEKRNKFNFDLIMKELEISQEEAQEYREREMKFQEQVTGKRMSMPQLRDIIGGAVIVPQKSLMKNEESADKRRIQIYTDNGSGFSEDNSYFIEEPYDGQGFVDFSIELACDVKKVRIDPYMSSCITRMEEVTFNGEALSLFSNRKVSVNGKKLEEESDYTMTVAFDSEDPGITIDVSAIIRSTGNTMHFKMQTIGVPSLMTQSLLKELKRKIRL